MKAINFTYNKPKIAEKQETIYKNHKFTIKTNENL